MRINVQDKASGPLRTFIAGLRNRRPMHVMIGNRVQNLVREHVRTWAGSHHASAQRLGASPTGFVSNAAEMVANARSVTSDANGVTLSLNHPFFARAFRDVDILPGAGKKFLTIPLNAFAYGKRAYRMPNLFVVKGCLCTKGNGKSLIFLYRLQESVHQKQERERLPDDNKIMEAAIEGVKDYARYLKTKQGGAA